MSVQAKKYIKKEKRTVFYTFTFIFDLYNFIKDVII